MSEYIVIPNWDRFQHYKGQDKPAWIKLHVALLHDDDFLDLTAAQRMALVGIWILYAESGRKLARDTAKLTRQLSQRITEQTLVSLNKAGFIEFSSRDGLETLYTQKRREEESREELSERTNVETPNPLLSLVEAESEKPKERRSNRYVQNARQYTGCRIVRGELAISHVYDPLGTEPKPSDWPHPTPSLDEIRKALREREDARAS